MKNFANAPFFFPVFPVRQRFLLLLELLRLFHQFLEFLEHLRLLLQTLRQRFLQNYQQFLLLPDKKFFELLLLLPHDRSGKNFYSSGRFISNFVCFSSSHRLSSDQTFNSSTRYRRFLFCSRWLRPHRIILPAAPCTIRTPPSVAC